MAKTVTTTDLRRVLPLKKCTKTVWTCLVVPLPTQMFHNQSCTLIRVSYSMFRFCINWIVRFVACSPFSVVIMWQQALFYDLKIRTVTVVSFSHTYTFKHYRMVSTKQCQPIQQKRCQCHLFCSFFSVSFFFLNVFKDCCCTL